ncbi:MAG TPA: D-alanine--D-alanine ligase family protein [Promineifilum sp.]|nr:D-alanine--D-alanine ligase family protein [Promineifilum sp.]HRO89879.1 D-alanine--D-alanine ligase family protein [Promineifilum sp.]HRQ14090.1 D-alanine--D-alanine ligase family protein [Promineifilum sp.]
MTRQTKLRIGVLFGGRSGEHEVSLRSARSVMAALDRDRYEIVPIGITKEGRWVAADVDALASGLVAGDARSATLLPEPADASLMAVDPVPSDPAASSISTITTLDVVFPVLHGTYGEDGTVQGLLELADVPFVGAGVVGSAVGMDKAIFKQVMTAAGLPVLPWVLCTRNQWRREPDAVIAAVESALPYPVFTKPANLGSSVGISKCRDRDELRAGLDEAARFDRRLVVEQGIHRARELEVAVLGNDEPVASVVGEVRPRREFYDYVAKYMAEPGSEDESELIIPAELAAGQAETIRELAVRAYKVIDCAGLGRVDLLLDDQSGQIYLNEINTIPGFTTISMYPKLWEATGMSYGELLDHLVDLALERHREKADMATSIDVTALQSGQRGVA